MSCFRKGLCVFLAVATMAGAGCSTYDKHRIAQTSQHKQNYIEDVGRARAGTLTRGEFEASLQSFDASMIEEQSKKGDKLPELQAGLEAESKDAANKIFGGN